MNVMPLIFVFIETEVGHYQTKIIIIHKFACQLHTFSIFSFGPIFCPFLTKKNNKILGSSVE